MKRETRILGSPGKGKERIGSIDDMVEAGREKKGPLKSRRYEFFRKPLNWGGRDRGAIKEKEKRLLVR